MSLSQRLQLKQTQQLVMTPQLQQAIRLLQITGQELVAAVAEEVEKNPLLKLDDAAGGATDAEGDSRPPEPVVVRSENIGGAESPFETGRENLYEGAPMRREAQGGDFTEWTSPPPTLRDHLLGQIALAPGRPPARMLAALLVDELDDDGYLRADLARLAERLGADSGLAEEAVAILQSCEPTGVGARSLEECLALQLRERDRCDPAMAALLERLDDVAALRLDRLAAACGLGAEDVRDMIVEIRALDPRPGSGFGGGAAQTLTPDVFVRRNNLGGWSVEVNGDALPKVLIDETYAAELSASGETEAVSFVADRRRDANWLIRALDQRAQTIVKVASEIVRRQHLFFEAGVSALRPMTLKQVADEIGMHESTVSRVTANKYLAADSGVFEMKFFFTQAVGGAGGGDAQSAEAVRNRIKTLVEREDPRKTLSDDSIVKLLKESGMDVARRTVAKYRESMNIPSSVQRRRRKAAALD